MTRPITPSYLTGIDCESKKDVMDDFYTWWDPACGIYGISESVKRALDEDAQKKRSIAYILAQRKCRGYSRPIKIMNPEKDYPLEPNSRWAMGTVDNLFAEYPKSTAQVIDEAFYNITRLALHPSDVIEISNKSCFLAYAHDNISRIYMIDQLKHLGLITMLNQSGDGSTFTVNAQGWKSVSEMERENKGNSDQAFVAMWFDPTMVEYFEKGILLSVNRDCGYVCKRIDLKEHNNKICDEIVTEIRRSRFVIADFSGNRGGVYYEAGFAHGLGIPVIWTVHKDHLSKVHFDTRQYNHIVYETPDELRTMLTNRIRATIY